MQIPERFTFGDAGLAYHFTGKEHALDAVIGACFSLSASVYAKIDIDQKGGGYVALLMPRATPDEASLRAFSDEFIATLDMQETRIAMLRKTRDFRETTIVQALLVSSDLSVSAAGTDFPDLPQKDYPAEEIKELEALAGLDDEDYMEDPLDIAKPWEEKYAPKEPGSK